jgi:hypothetical protein
LIHSDADDAGDPPAPDGQRQRLFISGEGSRDFTPHVSRSRRDQAICLMKRRHIAVERACFV